MGHSDVLCLVLTAQKNLTFPTPLCALPEINTQWSIIYLIPEARTMSGVKDRTKNSLRGQPTSDSDLTSFANTHIHVIKEKIIPMKIQIA